ncbi:MAG: hypothetical protein GC189_10545 [Alphaproteobacteria bacterium]|nr:hypothetical protein [Alphaproteobacteria bacterium]
MNSDLKNKLTGALGFIGALLGAGYAYNEIGPDAAIGGAIFGAILGVVAAHVIWAALIFALAVITIIVDFSGAAIMHEARRQVTTAVFESNAVAASAPAPSARYAPPVNAAPYSSAPNARQPATAVVTTPPQAPQHSATRLVRYAMSTRADFPVDLYAHMFRSGAHYDLFTEADTGAVVLQHSVAATHNIRRWVYFADFHSLAAQLHDGRYLGLPLQLHPQIERQVLRSRSIQIVHIQNGAPSASYAAPVDVEDIAG